MGVELGELSVQDLLGLNRQILAELRARNVVRTANPPAGDWAELLVKTVTGGSLAPNSEKSFDVLTPDGARLQVKARLLDPDKVGSQTLSAIRSWNFDELVVILFRPDDFRVAAAASIPVASVKTLARHSSHVNAFIVRPTRALLALGEDWTAEVMHAAETF